MYIEELIRNTKVKWKTVGEVCEVKRGRVISKQYLEDNKGEFPVYSSQTLKNGEIGRIDTYDYEGEYGSWTTDGAYAGTVFFREGKFSITNICGLLNPDREILNVRFLVYLLQIEAKKHVKSGSGNPKLMSNVMQKIKIPIPPLEVQEKIVETLDKFTEYIKGLTAELTKELNLRKKQYIYYRDMFLSEEYLIKLSETFDKVEGQGKVVWTTLSEVGKFTNGSGMPKSMFDENGQVGAIHYGHIYTKYQNVVTEPIVKISEENAKKLKKVQKGDLVIARTSENIDDIMKTVVYLGDKEVVVGGHSAIYKHNQNPEYLTHVFNGSVNFLRQKNRLVRGTKVIELSTKEMDKISIPLPSLLVQDYVVAVINKYTTLYNDLAYGLVKEIELSRKQYEYYRNKILTFN
ncbi:restriction endonuclease subunit S [Sutcliffiella horikoshii]|uniref:restriction endonuclease subunit S n=1 Tax=Sutcliffiella horikoshii TaxID=79883 RepID=UPI00384E919F